MRGLAQGTAGFSSGSGSRRAVLEHEGSSSTRSNVARGHAVSRSPTRRLARIAVMLAVLLVAGGSARARVLGDARDVPTDRVSLELQNDPVLLLEAGYGHDWPELRQLQLEAALTVPLLNIHRLDDFELSLGASLELWRRGRWGLRGGLFGSVAFTSNAAGDFAALGLELVLAPGYFDERWFLALDLRVRATVAAHLSHSDRVRDTFDERYPEGTPEAGRINGPRDGWVAFPATRYVVGLAGGYTIARRVTVYGAGGLDILPAAEGVFFGPGISVIPFYGILGAAVHW